MAWWRPRAAAAGLVLAALMMLGCAELYTVVVDEEAAGATAQSTTASATESAESEVRATEDDDLDERDAADAESGSALANDPINLLSVESSVNRSRGDGDAATWLPPRTGHRCGCVARQIRVKHD